MKHLKAIYSGFFIWELLRTFTFPHFHCTGSMARTLAFLSSLMLCVAVCGMCLWGHERETNGSITVFGTAFPCTVFSPLPVVSSLQMNDGSPLRSGFYGETREERTFLKNVCIHSFPIAEKQESIVLRCSSCYQLARAMPGVSAEAMGLLWD